MQGVRNSVFKSFKSVFENLRFRGPPPDQYTSVFDRLSVDSHIKTEVFGNAGFRKRITVDGPSEPQPATTHLDAAFLLWI